MKHASYKVRSRTRRRSGFKYIYIIMYTSFIHIYIKGASTNRVYIIDRLVDLA